jgi:predicted O-linked N-acetylglucosamine transferase (SPINDLY family)
LPPPSGTRDQGRRLRIGYVSADFWRHPVAAFMEPALRCHDRDNFQTFIYSDRTTPDSTTERLRTMVGHWRDAFGWTDAELAARMRADEIDILVELAGHTAQNRLGAVALRPAPIQVSYLGYPSTTGLASIDYRLTDALTDPPGEPVQYTEQLWRLSPGFCCYAAADDAPPVSPLPCLSQPEITLGALHHLAKLNGQVLDLWATLLNSLPECRLLVFRDTLHGTAARRLARELTARGLAAHRFELRPTLPASGSHLSLYDEIDVSLDVLPWSGHTTACESLWMGVPVVSLPGNRFAGRMVASVLTLAGLPQWIAQDPDQYVAIVRRFTADRAALAKLRSELRARVASSPLCDGATFTRSLEDAYRGMWRRYCAGAPQSPGI